MFCKKCGAEMADTDQVCPSCGAPVEQTPAEQTPVETGSAPAAAVKPDPLRLSALICQTVGALFMVIACFQLMGNFNSASFLFEMIGVGFISPLATVLSLCAAVAAVLVPVCLWLQFVGRLNPANGKLADQGGKFLPTAILVQMIVECVLYGLMILMLLIVVVNSDAREMMSALSMSGNVTMLLLGVIVMAAAVIFLHVMALKLTKGAAPDMTAAIACFVAGGVHTLTLLVLLSNTNAMTVLLLAGYAAADILYGLITMQAAKK